MESIQEIIPYLVIRFRLSKYPKYLKSKVSFDVFFSTLKKGQFTIYDKNKIFQLITSDKATKLSFKKEIKFQQVRVFQSQQIPRIKSINIAEH